LTAALDAVWDTTVACGLQPHTALHRYAEDRAAQGAKVIVASIALAEIATGYRRKADLGDTRYQRLLHWVHTLAGSDTIEVASLDGLGAIAYGQARQRQPTPPAARRASGQRSRTQHRAAWLHDLQIAATAWSRGLPVATENVTDFQRASTILAELYPHASPLAVLSATDLDLP
jgi:predicted nucleic acid-binding protein